MPTSMRKRGEIIQNPSPLLKSRERGPFLRRRSVAPPGKLAAAKSKGTSPKAAPEAATDADDEVTPSADDNGKDPVIDPERDEALNILGDLVDLTRGPKTASANTSESPAQHGP